MELLLWRSKCWKYRKIVFSSFGDKKRRIFYRNPNLNLPKKWHRVRFLFFMYLKQQTNQYQYVRNSKRTNTNMYRTASKTIPICTEQQAKQYQYVRNSKRTNTNMYGTANEPISICTEQQTNQYQYVRNSKQTNTNMYRTHHFIFYIFFGQRISRN